MKFSIMKFILGLITLLINACCLCATQSPKATIMNKEEVMQMALSKRWLKLPNQEDYDPLKLIPSLQPKLYWDSTTQVYTIEYSTYKSINTAKYKTTNGATLERKQVLIIDAVTGLLIQKMNLNIKHPNYE